MCIRDRRMGCQEDGCECSAFVKKKDDAVRMILLGAHCLRCNHEADSHSEAPKKTSCILCNCSGYRHRVGALPREWRTRICHHDECKHDFTLHETDVETQHRHQIELNAMQAQPGPWRLTHMATWMLPEPVIDYDMVAQHAALQPPKKRSAKKPAGPPRKELVTTPFSTLQLDEVSKINLRKDNERVDKVNRWR
eukprot:TRINITY_DN19271_c0_g1_i1.p1 TRINITY_DN19271_c0_g1~~TRINITY_DN19271_c0_g1_i1.p1  ORF type:complete len:194 (-),score=28.03 TRINITY_DN19271_c0_g1_i1:239-820(-)